MAEPTAADLLAKPSESQAKGSPLMRRVGNCVCLLSKLFGSFGAAKLQADLPNLWLLYVLLGFLLKMDLLL